MARRLRRPSQTGIHHVMNRGADRQAIFLADHDRLEFGHRLVRVHRELDVGVIAYCLMDNHYHLVLRVPDGVLPEAMKHIGQVFTQRTNRRVDRDGSLFRGRYHSIPVETDAYLLAAVRYVHRNPLDIAGVDRPAQHRWSSYPAYLGIRPTPEFLDVRPVMDLAGDRARLRSYTEGELEPAPQAWVWRPSFTSTDVRHLIVGALAAEHLAHPDQALGPRLDRTLLHLIADRSPDARLRDELFDELGHRSHRDRVRPVARARKRLAEEPSIGRLLTWVEDALAA